MADSVFSEGRWLHRRVARRHYTCESCQRSIRPGETYTEWVYPPFWEGINGPRWVRLASHRANPDAPACLSGSSGGSGE